MARAIRRSISGDTRRALCRQPIQPFVYAHEVIAADDGQATGEALSLKLEPMLGKPAHRPADVLASAASVTTRGRSSGRDERRAIWSDRGQARGYG